VGKQFLPLAARRRPLAKIVRIEMEFAG